MGEKDRETDCFLGTSAITDGLANELPPGSVFINSPVDSIHQTPDGALIETSTGNKIFARKVVVAIPTNTYSNIDFSPPLPSAKRALVSRTKPGVYAKMILTYSKAWWKDLGFQGKFTSLKGPICFSWEISDDSKKQYSLALFIAGDVAAKWSELNELQRQESIIDHLAELVGAENSSLARDVLEVNYVNWTEESYLGVRQPRPWVQGCCPSMETLCGSHSNTSTSRVVRRLMNGRVTWRSTFSRLASRR